MSTTRTSAKVVIFFLGIFALLGLGGTIWLVSIKVPGELIAIVSGLTGTALGGLTGLLSQTEKPAPPSNG